MASDLPPIKLGGQIAASPPSPSSAKPSAVAHRAAALHKLPAPLIIPSVCLAAGPVSCGPPILEPVGLRKGLSQVSMSYIEARGRQAKTPSGLSASPPNLLSVSPPVHGTSPKTPTGGRLTPFSAPVGNASSPPSPPYLYLGDAKSPGMPPMPPMSLSSSPEKSPVASPSSSSSSSMLWHLPMMPRNASKTKLATQGEAVRQRSHSETQAVSPLLFRKYEQEIAEAKKAQELALEESVEMSRKLDQARGDTEELQQREKTLQALCELWSSRVVNEEKANTTANNRLSARIGETQGELSKVIEEITRTEDQVGKLSRLVEIAKEERKQLESSVESVSMRLEIMVSQVQPLRDYSDPQKRALLPQRDKLAASLVAENNLLKDRIDLWTSEADKREKMMEPKKKQLKTLMDEVASLERSADTQKQRRAASAARRRAEAECATDVFCDIEDKQQLWEDYPAAMLLACKAQCNIIRSCIENHEGFEFKSDGENFGVSFSSAISAALCSVAIHQRLAVYTWPNGLPCGLKVRVGLNTGEVYPVVAKGQRGGSKIDYFGPVVNKAARVFSSAAGGTTLLTEATMEAIKAEEESSTGWSNLIFEARGAKQLKGFAGEENIFEVSSKVQCAPDEAETAVAGEEGPGPMKLTQSQKRASDLICQLMDGKLSDKIIDEASKLKQQLAVIVAEQEALEAQCGGLRGESAKLKSANFELQRSLVSFKYEALKGVQFIDGVDNAQVRIANARRAAVERLPTAEQALVRCRTELQAALQKSTGLDRALALGGTTGDVLLSKLLDSGKATARNGDVALKALYESVRTLAASLEEMRAREDAVVRALGGLAKKSGEGDLAATPQRLDSASVSRAKELGRLISRGDSYINLLPDRALACGHESDTALSIEVAFDLRCRALVLEARIRDAKAAKEEAEVLWELADGDMLDRDSDIQDLEGVLATAVAALDSTRALVEVEQRKLDRASQEFSEALRGRTQQNLTLALVVADTEAVLRRDLTKALRDSEAARAIEDTYQLYFPSQSRREGQGSARRRDPAERLPEVLRTARSEKDLEALVAAMRAPPARSGSATAARGAGATPGTPKRSIFLKRARSLMLGKEQRGPELSQVTLGSQKGLFSQAVIARPDGPVVKTLVSL
eukprot:m51a1_g4763 putative adenylate cyclase (1139) ;mRNA; r:409-4307